jgi:effector-binding domain-containing protein
MTHVHAIGAALVALVAVSGAEGAQRAAAPKPAPSPAQAPQAADFQVLKVPAIHAVVLPMKGSYAQHQTAFERVDAFLTNHHLSRALPLFARYYNNPSAGDANLVWEVGSPVPAGVAAEPPFEIKDIPAELAVVHVYRGSYADLGAAWSALNQWALAHHHKATGPTMQVFNSLMPPELELRLPVRK